MQAKRDGALDRLAVVILNWNNSRLTLACVDSVVASRESLYGLGCEMGLYVVDNGLDDADIASLRRGLSGRSEEISLVENATNLGFAGGMNVGIAAAQQHAPKYIFLLNNDTTVADRAAAQLYTFAEQHPYCAMIAPTIVDLRTGTLQSAGGYRYYPCLGWSRPLGGGEPLAVVEDLPAVEPDYIDGAAMWLRGDFLARTGGLPRDYFLYFEELALKDLLRANERQCWCREAIVYHAGGGDDTSRGRQVSATYNAALSAFRYTRANHPRCLPGVVAARLAGIALRATFRLQPWLLPPCCAHCGISCAPIGEIAGEGEQAQVENPAQQHTNGVRSLIVDLPMTDSISLA
ncbi:MAG: glycosyltransferase family 2 protein [Halioglobus sp.]|nr:glycosyltransferase family 2 protein [Halioglobus sp.]